MAMRDISVSWQDERAYYFALAAHTAVNQKRKYTGEPYFNHPIEVRGIVEDYATSNPDILAAALLHDVLEDTGVTEADMRPHFPSTVVDYVVWMTHIAVGPAYEGVSRADRKKADREFIANAPPAVKTIKLADVISNTKSIAEHDPKFSRVYLPEMALLIEVLKEGDPTLYSLAKSQVTKAMADLSISRSN